MKIPSQPLLAGHILLALRHLGSRCINYQSISLVNEWLSLMPHTTRSSEEHSLCSWLEMSHSPPISPDTKKRSKVKFKSL
ncbi:uncharacterized protein P174DRAFT_111631 [Aspergillus novofumigatus IBT 16806]|uniref:Uncharacterized protein n=1 Tax=Aspergillus novofumigatus (strain IBT 16806) TaxID=1392255 RepID=A0A2I1CIT4_ASPN1|nr:uncharacterized protein P174DRAFT_111631 [Aspergillus novofumigatus IBT 16806]PKX97504.1 hypothetical protein P174DRAFT_111631 [Aspergillus novofumigatus IBT 16806]